MFKLCKIVTNRRRPELLDGEDYRAGLKFLSEERLIGVKPSAVESRRKSSSFCGEFWIHFQFCLLSSRLQMSQSTFRHLNVQQRVITTHKVVGQPLIAFSSQRRQINDCLQPFAVSFTHKYTEEADNSEIESAGAGDVPTLPFVSVVWRHNETRRRKFH
ncbi:Hypothetical predicted protein [Scomber scombrus]|uniref:Uncharacterized protein n=1 Tax=Scomber scombrus TaxID=13677 RepID=A0AAV1N4R7_SCOSC